MIDSRDLSLLREPAKERIISFLAEYKQATGVELLITSTLRDYTCQNMLYAKGRTISGNIVTNARGGESFHNYGLAMDAYPLVHGKPLWEATYNSVASGDVLYPEWESYGKIAKLHELEWGWDWRRFRECPHLQYSGGLSIAQLQAGDFPT